MRKKIKKKKKKETSKKTKKKKKCILNLRLLWEVIKMCRIPQNFRNRMKKTWYLKNASVFVTDFIGSSHGVFLMRAKKESKKSGLKLNIQNTKWHHGIWYHHFMESVTNFILGGFKITPDSDCSHKIKRHLLLRRKAMTNLDSLLKSKDLTLLTKIHIVKVMIFPIVMYRCESWTIKKAERQRIDAFELWCWRRLLRVPWTARRSNQSILKKINPKYSMEGLMLKLKLQYFGHLMQRIDSLEKTLMLGKTEGKNKGAMENEVVREHHWLNGHECKQIPGDSGGQRSLACAVHGITKSWTQLSDWTALTELASDLIPTSPTRPSEVSEKPGDGPDQLH